MTPDVTRALPRLAHQKMLKEEQAKDDHTTDLLLVCHRITTIAKVP